MRHARFALILALLSLVSAAACGAERKSMLDVLISIIPKSDEVIATVVRGTQPVTVDGEDFIRVSADVVEIFKSGADRPQKIAVDLKEEGDETPNMRIGETYLFFLRRGNEGKEAGRRFLTGLSRPLRAPADKKDAYFALMRDYVAIAAVEPAKRDLKPFVLKVLHSGIPLFHEDAAITANIPTDWSPAELEKIKEILAPQGRAIPPKGIERDNLVALVIIQGTATQALAQGRMEFKQGNIDSVYYGMNMRKAPDVDRIFTSFFDDQDPAIRGGGLKVAGLLKKKTLIDQFEQKNGKLDEETRSALAEARKFLARD